MIKLYRWVLSLLQLCRYFWLIYRTDEGVFKHPSGYLLTYYHLDTALLYIGVAKDRVTFHYRNRTPVVIYYKHSWLYRGFWAYVDKRFNHPSTATVN